MARFSSAVAARSAGDEGTEALLVTDVSVVAAMSTAIAEPVRIHVLVFIGISSGSKSRGIFRREEELASLSDSLPEIDSGGNYSVADCCRSASSVDDS